jgi:hypothetical protein
MKKQTGSMLEMFQATDEATGVGKAGLHRPQHHLPPVSEE